MAPKFSKPASSSGYEPEEATPGLHDIGSISKDEGSDHSNTSSDAESTNGTEDEEKQETDFQQNTDNDKNDDGHDGDDGVGCVESQKISREFQTLIDEMPDIEHLEEHFATMLRKVSNKEEYNYLFTFARKNLKVFFDYASSAKKAISDIDKEAKKQKAKEERAHKKEIEKETRRAFREETITVNFKVGSETFSLKVEKGDTVGSIRAKIIEMMKKKLKFKKLKKSDIAMTFGKVIISENPRMTAGKAGLTDGCVLLIGGGIHGGAKRRGVDDSRSSYDDKVREIKDELAVIFMRGQIQPTPLTIECLNFLDILKGKVLSSGDAVENYDASMK